MASVFPPAPMHIFDISVPISNQTPVYKGDPAVKLERTSDVNRGDSLTLSRIEMGAHTGTHIDAPLHFIRGGATVDELDLNILIGQAVVVDLSGVKEAITAVDLENASVPARAERILFKTSNSALWMKNDFQENFVAFAPSAAEWLIEHRVRLVAIDYLSAELFGADEAQVHRLLLAAGVIIVEGVNLTEIAAGAYQLICLPLKLKRAEGAPARAVLIQE